ncbi:hypothetical protein SCANM63S_05947 [Streptomyces canarius]
MRYGSSSSAFHSSPNRARSASGISVRRAPTSSRRASMFLSDSVRTNVTWSDFDMVARSGNSCRMRSSSPGSTVRHCSPVGTSAKALSVR